MQDLERQSPQWDPRFAEPLAAWVVRVVELDPPEGVEPIEWILLTSEAVESFEQACERVDWNACRWIIEEWHKADTWPAKATPHPAGRLSGKDGRISCSWSWALSTTWRPTSLRLMRKAQGASLVTYATT